MGPLSGLRVVELAGIGPGPFAAMMLADMGARVLRVEPPGGVTIGVPAEPRFDTMARGRAALRLDLKDAAHRDLALDLVAEADALLEGFRPGVAERLGLGPDACLARNRRLVYGRVTGWGQDGPLAAAAGHDIDYVALAGVLGMVGRAGAPPTPPINLVGDFGGGGMLLAFGIVCALWETARSGKGQVVDAAMVDGAALLATLIFGLRAAGAWPGGRGENILDSGAPYYDVYECADGRWLAVGALEPKFFAELCRRLGLEGLEAGQHDRAAWPSIRARLAARLRERTRDEWCELMAATDACVAPVLDPDEAPRHPHNAARGTFLEVDGVVQPAPAPRFSRTAPSPPSRPQLRAALEAWGLPPEQVVAALAAHGSGVRTSSTSQPS
jgi:alpha-methylacyl-CoA racemase